MMKYTPEKYCDGWQVGRNGHLIRRKRDAVAVCKLLNKYGAWEFEATVAIEDFNGNVSAQKRKCYIAGGGVCVDANRPHFERVAYGDIEFSELASLFISDTLIDEIN